MRQTKRKKFMSGFTLLEVIISLAFLGIMFGALMPILDTSFKMNLKSVQLLEDAINASSGTEAMDLAKKLFEDNILLEEMPSGIRYVHMPSEIRVGEGIATIDWLTNPNVGDAGSPYGRLPVLLVQKVNGVIFYFYIPFHPFRCGADGDDCPTCVIPIKLPGAEGEKPPEFEEELPLG